MKNQKRRFNNDKYRYGFNGKENDNEAKGTGNQQDYGMRIYDPRLGRFLSIDPITNSYPELTPYQFASNSPIELIDFDGLEGIRPISFPIFIMTSEDWKNAAKGFMNGVKQLAHDLAPIRPADENDPKTITEAINNLKSIPENLSKIPAILEDVYSDGTTEEKVETTVKVVGTILAVTKGKSSSPAPLKILQAGFNPKSRILTFIQGTKNKIMQSVKLPDGFEKIKVEGSKADVFKQKGKNIFITPDIDSHTGGMWKRATGKAENLFKKETREGTYNADLSKKIDD